MTHRVAQHTISHNTAYLHGKDILVCIKTFREEAGHEVVHVCYVSYSYSGELQQVKTVALPKSQLVQLQTKRRGRKAL